MIPFRRDTLAYRLWFATASRLTKTRTFNGLPLAVPDFVGKRYIPYTDTPYEVEEWEAIQQFGKPGGTFVDIGANIGVLTAAMSRIAGPTGQVLAFEPNPDAHYFLTEIMRLNGCNNVLAHQTLVTDKCGAMPFSLSPAGGLGVRSSIAHEDPGATQVIMPCVTLDAMREQGLRIDYIKVDAEGAELRILVGAETILREDRPVVQVEVHGPYLPGLGDSVEDLFAYIVGLDYRIINAATWAETSASEFAVNTHCHAPDTYTRQDMAYLGYGQIVCLPRESTAPIPSRHVCPHCADGKQDSGERLPEIKDPS